jgi:hypothetical protein
MESPDARFSECICFQKNRRTMKHVLNVLVAACVVAIAIFSGSCERPTMPANPNSPPHTRLANIPKDSSTVFALATLYWDGGDNDGYITRYQYRYFTYHWAPSTGAWVIFDSIAWKDTTASTVTIPFNSTDSLNRQIFYVRAIDNDGNVDPKPASKMLYTTRTAPPVTKLYAPAKNSVVLVAQQITDWWYGVNIVFNAKDQAKEGAIVGYAWSVDSGPWTWVSDTSISLPPSVFGQPLNGQHTIRVTSRNNTNLVDPVGDSARVNLIVPSFAKSVLIIDETDEYNSPFVTMGITDSVTDAFYAELFPGSDQWDFKAKGMPPRDVLAQYKLLVWHADDVPVSVPHKISQPANIAIFTDYLKVGGKFFMSGWRILKSFAYTSNFPHAFPPGTFVHDYLHIYTVDETDVIGDMIGGRGLGTFSDFQVDSTKLALFPYSGKLSWVNLITKTAGFTEGMYTYVNRDDSPYTEYRGRFIAGRYYGTVYDAVVLGFPMYFIAKDDAKLMTQQIMHSLHVN